MNKGRILLGLSGGVDSAVAAHLLKVEGYEVVGCFMRNWDSIANNDYLGNPTLNNDECSQETDYHDALITAKELGIELLRADFIKEYWDDVFSYFLKEYERGRTPNADVFCNKYIKFEAFRKFAHEHGFQKIAMGHYAKKVKYEGYSYLYKAEDKSKDQSYFLSQISEEQLAESVFPLASICKTEVREIAERLHLTIAKKKDSTGVCFIGERHFKEFLKNYLPAKSGDIVDYESKKVVGTHDGVLFYTVGQIKGLGIGGSKEFGSIPWIVVGKDVPHNILYVTNLESPYLYSTKAIITDVNYLNPTKPDGPIKVGVKFRYRAQDEGCTLRFIDERTVELIYDKKLKSIAKGQIAVFYLGERCLGGGKIDEIYDGDKLITI